jgi:hypothetical protein
VKLVPTSEIQMLGVPLGSFEFVDDFVKKKLLSRLDSAVQKLVDFEDSQAALFLLRISFSIVRALHFMRTTPLTLWRDQAVKFDAKVRDAAEKIIACPMSDRVYTQACLTPKLGGLGLRRTSEHADVAFAASWHESRVTAREVWVRPPGVPEVAMSQKQASFKFDEAKLTWLLSTSPDQRESQRLSRCAQPHAGGFITAVPSCEDGYDTVIAPRNFRIAVQYRLGIPVIGPGSTCPMCMQPIDIFGDHAVCCTKAGDIVVRHNRLRNLIDSVASDGLLNPVMEKKGILGPTSGRRPGDVTIPIWQEGKGLAIDVAVTSSLSKGNVGIGQPCEVYAEQQKHKKYDASFEGKPYLFSPVVLETLGPINSEGCQVLSQLFRFAAKRLGREFSSFCGRGWGRVSCNLQRSVSQSILNRIDGRIAPPHVDDANLDPPPSLPLLSVPPSSPPLPPPLSITPLRSFPTPSSSSLFVSSPPSSSVTPPRFRCAPYRLGCQMPTSGPNLTCEVCSTVGLLSNCSAHMSDCGDDIFAACHLCSRVLCYKHMAECFCSGFGPPPSSSPLSSSPLCPSLFSPTPSSSL